MQYGIGLAESLDLAGMSAGLRCSRRFGDAPPQAGTGNTGRKAIFPNARPREIDSIGTNVRRAFTVGAFPQESASRCTRLLDATLMQAD